MKDAARARRRRIDTTPHLPQPRKENATTRLSTRRAAAARWETARSAGNFALPPPSRAPADSALALAEAQGRHRADARAVAERPQERHQRAALARAGSRSYAP